MKLTKKPEFELHTGNMTLLKCDDQQFLLKNLNYKGKIIIYRSILLNGEIIYK